MQGPARNYGRNMMWSYLRTELHLNLRRDDVHTALVHIYQQQGRSRERQQHPTHRRQAIFRGPNWVWSVDGHEKLRNWGIDIYGAIDGYSRYIIWMWVGPSSLTQVCVAKQYLQAIEEHSIRPFFIRSDRGTETALMADTHYSLEVYYQSRWFGHDQASNPFPLRWCYLYGKSTANQRIESFWLRLINLCTGSWMVSNIDYWVHVLGVSNHHSSAIIAVPPRA